VGNGFERVIVIPRGRASGRHNWSEVAGRLVGSHDGIARNLDARGEVVTKVDAVVETHEESVGIPVNSCEHIPHTVMFQNVSHNFPTIPVLQAHISRDEKRSTKTRRT
jgi:hypothetical protein